MQLLLPAADILAYAWKIDKSVNGVDGAATVNSAPHCSAGPSRSMRW